MSIRSYFEVTKPKTVALLVFTSLVAMVIASRLKGTELTSELLLSGLIAITAGCAGCNAVTCYLDRDIDALMMRTRTRPLPSGKISPPYRALWLGSILIVISLVLSLIRNFLSFALLALGVFDNVIVYSLLLKRRNPLNILLGGISGGLVVAFGWAYIAESLSLTAIVMAALVVLWIPNHIWSLVLYHREDYEVARIPMLPIVVEEEEAVRCIALMSVLLVVFSVLPFILGIFSFPYLAVAGILGAPLLALGLLLFIRPSKRNAWRVFKFSSPYLAAVFLAMMIDVLLFSKW